RPGHGTNRRGPGGAIGLQETPKDLATRVVALDVVPLSDPQIGSDEGDLVSQRRALAEVVREERESGAQAGLLLPADVADDLGDRLLAQPWLAPCPRPPPPPPLPPPPPPPPPARLAAPSDRPRRVHDTRGIGPLGQTLARRTRREPHRQLTGGMEMERPAQRPCLHERAVAPERVAHVLLHDPVDARRELQLGGRLHLCVDPADLTRDVDERGGALRQRASREPARAHLLPGQRNRRRSTSLPPLSHDSRPRSMIWT